MSAQAPPRMAFRAASGWRLALVVFGLAVVVLLAGYWQTVESLVHVWAHSGTYQYAFLIFPLSAWTALNLRHRLRERAPAPSVWGLVAVAVLAALWYAGHLLDINLAQHFAFVALFPALALTCWGWRALWVLVFPLGYLVVFAVPWGGALVGPLQDLTAHFAVGALNLTGTPVLINGREIVTPSATWMVAQACSGVKFFIACTALGCLFAYLMYRPWWKRVLFVVLSAVVPIIANGLRVYFTVLIGETFGLHYATGTDHMVFGWQFFGTVLVLLLLVGWFFRDPLVARQTHAARDAKPPGLRAVVWPVALALLVAGPLVAAGMAVQVVPQKQLHLAAPPLAGWTGPRTPSDQWRPSFTGAAGQFHAAYRQDGDGAKVAVFHAVYTGKPRRGHDLITYGNEVYDPAKSRILATASRHIELADGTGITARELRLAGAGGPRLVWYWYCVAGHCTDSPFVAKLVQAWNVLRGRVPRTSVWALSSPIADSHANNHAGDTRARLRAFARMLTGVGTADLPSTRQIATRGQP